MTLHTCAVCFAPAATHSESCECGVHHFPALCCPGCVCGSYEAAHAPVETPQADRPLNILHLTLKKQWFDMIVSGVKREEYREVKPHWNRLLLHRYDAVKFRNGYRPDSPTATFRLREVLRGLGIVEWGAPEGKQVYILRLGERLA